MIYGYARVSSKGQESHGNGLEVQTRLLKEAGAEVIYAEAFTGTKKHRPKLDELLSNIRQGDTLVVAKLDRIARSTVDGIELIREITEKGCILNVLNMGKFDDSPSGKLMRTVMLAFAEFERDMIVTRTQEGKEVARTREGFREGRPGLVVDKEAFEKCLKNKKDGLMTVKECCEELGISRASWYNLCKGVA